jgi:putative phosphoribosyl transferase
MFDHSPQRAGYTDRLEAGAALARRLEHLHGRDAVVLALPRGGVPVGYQVARALGAPLDVFVVRKLGLPGQPEFAMGAIASGGVRVLDDEIVGAFGVSPEAIDAVTRVEQAELERRERAYRAGGAPVSIEGRIAILVDDGLATGSTMRAAVAAVRRLKPARIVVAVPVGARDSCDELRAAADEVVCLLTPEPFRAVGLWYADFSETTDAQVRELLGLATSTGSVPTRSA